MCKIKQNSEFKKFKYFTKIKIYINHRKTIIKSAHQYKRNQKLSEYFFSKYTLDEFSKLSLHFNNIKLKSSVFNN